MRANELRGIYGQPKYIFYAFIDLFPKVQVEDL